MSFEKLTEYLNILTTQVGVPALDMTVWHGHSEVYRHIAGWSDAATTKKASENDLYYMYSCSKPLTVTAGMQLIEAGKLDLEDPACRYLPEYGDAFYIKGDKKIKVGDGLKIRHLFTMTAGLDYSLRTPEIEAVLNETDGKATTRQLVAAFAKSRLHFAPGEQFQYSLCHDVLAAVIEVVSGERFSQYMKHHIFDLLGMGNTGFHPGREQLDKMSAQYKYDADNKILTETPKVNTLVPTPNYDSGGSGVVSSANDYALFADAMANGGIGKNGARLLKSASVDLLRYEHLSSFIRTDSFGCTGGAGYGYGLGVRTLISKADGQKSGLGEFGWDGAAGTDIMIDPQHKLSFVLCMHVLGWPELLGFIHPKLRDIVCEAMGFN